MAGMASVRAAGQAPADLICRLVWAGSHSGRARRTRQVPGRYRRNRGALVCGPRQYAAEPSAEASFRRRSPRSGWAL